MVTQQYSMKRVKVGGQSRGNINDIWMSLSMPRHFTHERTSAVLAQMEAYLESKREVYNIRTTRAHYRKYWGGIHIFMHSAMSDPWWYVSYKDLRKKIGAPVDSVMTRKEVIQDLKKNAPNFVGIRMSIWGAGGSGSSDPNISVYLYGDDTEVLAKLSEEVERRIRMIPEVVSVDTDLERGDDEVQIRIEREQARKYGISPQVIGRTIGFGLRGRELPRYHDGVRDIRVRVYLEEADRQTLQQLKNFTFRSKEGREIPLEALASVQVQKGTGTIRRENGKTWLRVKAFTTQDNLKDLPKRKEN